MDPEGPEWTPDRRSSPWLSREPWEKIGEHEAICDEHGPYVSVRYRGVTPPNWRASDLNPGLDRFIRDWNSRCPRCDDMIHAEQVASYEEAMCGAERRAELRRQMAHVAGIPPRYALAEPFTTMREFHPKMGPAIKAVRQYCQDMPLNLQSGRCLIVTGAIGTGKTYAGCAIANYVISKGGTSKYAVSEDIGCAVRDSYGAVDRESSVIESFSSVDLLVLDEVGRFDSSDHSKRMVGLVLDKRYRECRPSVVLSNLSKSQLALYVGSAVWDRITQGGAKVLGFAWESLRPREDVDA